jgi:hypothetical protein
MLTDKEIALSIIDALENLALDSAVYQIVLDEITKGLPQANWRETFDLIRKDPRFESDAHARFVRLREAVLHAPDLSAAVRQILEGLEATDQGEIGSQ